MHRSKSAGGAFAAEEHLGSRESGGRLDLEAGAQVRGRPFRCGLQHGLGSFQELGAKEESILLHA